VRELDECGFGRVVHGADEALVGDEAAHGRDEHDRTAGFEAEHLARRGGGGHEDACAVGREHFRGVGDRVVDCRAGFLYPGRCIKGSEMGWLKLPGLGRIGWFGGRGRIRNLSIKKGWGRGGLGRAEGRGLGIEGRNARRTSYQTVRLLIFLSYPGDDTIERFVVSHVYLRVVQLAAEFGEDAPASFSEGVVGLGEAV
jgi:hypothetical protein